MCSPSILLSCRYTCWQCLPPLHGYTLKTKQNKTLHLCISVGQLGSKCVFAIHKLLPLDHQPAAVHGPGTVSFRWPLTPHGKVHWTFPELHLTVEMCLGLWDHSHLEKFLLWLPRPIPLLIFFSGVAFFPRSFAASFSLTLRFIPWSSSLHQSLTNLAQSYDKWLPKFCLQLICIHSWPSSA